MKSRQNSILLAAFALIVWVFLGMQLNSRLKDDSPKTGIERPKVEQESKPASLQDSFELRLEYRDPFKGGRSIPKKIAKQPEKKAKVQKSLAVKPPKPQPKSVLFPTLNYLGVMVEPGDSRSYAIVRTGNQDHFLLIGDSVRTAVIKSIHADSLVLGLDGQTRTYKRSE